MNARSAERLLLWDGNSASFRDNTSTAVVGHEPPLIVDSWLTTDGRVRAFWAHMDRFGAACAAMYGIPADEIMPFMSSAITQIPVRGRWFPRVELVFSGGDPQLQLRIRPAPKQGLPVTLWVSEEPDRRRHPDVKGPDLPYLAGLRAQAVERGADEALILSADGSVSEGASTSVLWWRADTLCAPPLTPHRLGGVTSRLLIDAVRDNGFRTRTEQVRPADLAGLEVWVVNALHGIRPVIGWRNLDAQPGPARRASRWIAHLDGLATVSEQSSASDQRSVTGDRPTWSEPVRRAPQPALIRP